MRRDETNEGFAFAWTPGAAFNVHRGGTKKMVVAGTLALAITGCGGNSLSGFSPPPTGEIIPFSFAKNIDDAALNSSMAALFKAHFGETMIGSDEYCLGDLTQTPGTISEGLPRGVSPDGVREVPIGGQVNCFAGGYYHSGIATFIVTATAPFWKLLHWSNPQAPMTAPEGGFLFSNTS